MNPGYLKIVLAVLIWSSWGIIIHWLKLPAVLVCFSTNFFGWLGLSALLVRKSGEIRPGSIGIKKLAFFVLIGAMVNLNNIAYYQAFQFTSVANTVFSHYLAPVLVFLMVPFLLSEKIEFRAYISLFISLAGLYLIINGPGLEIAASDLQGIGLGLFSALFYALIIVAYRYLAPGLSAFTLTWYSNLATFLLVLPLALPQIHEALSLPVLVPLFFVGLVNSGLAPMIYISGLKTVPAHHAGILGYLEPIGGIIFAFFLLSEPLGFSKIAGAILIFGAGYYLVRPKIVRIEK